MKKLTAISLLSVLVVFLTGQIIAVYAVNPNGFPSGPHYNLNIIGKKDGFTCPEQQYYLRVTYCGCGAHEIGDLVESCDPADKCEQTTIPIYGNVVFVPENGEGIEIYMQSGKGKKAADIPTLQAIDPCAVFDGDGAIIQLPKNEAGYRVYARALAKPGDNTSMTISPELVAVEDEDGTDLMYLGLVTSSGFETPYVSFTRPKGKSKAVDITGLFLWTGTIWYLTEPDVYQYTKYLHEGTYDECTDYYLDPVTGEPVCPDGYALVLAYFNEYSAEWVFNIGDFVTYLWDADNNGIKLLQVRFYPNDPSPELAPSSHRTLATQWGKIK